MDLRLLLHPGEALAKVRDREATAWPLAITGFGNLAFIEGYDRFLRQTLPFAPELAMACFYLGALLFGSWLWAVFFGGLLHVAARLLGGQDGWGMSVHLVGLALFWPGLICVVSVEMAVLFGYRGSDVDGFAVIPLLLSLAAAIWANYNVLLAVCIRHRFTWWRALATYGCFLLFFLIVAVFAFLMLYRARSPA